MTHRRDVTVIVPTRDRAAVLPATIKAVLAQRDIDLALIVVDDGSTDATPAVLSAFANRVAVVRHATPQRVGAARNAGLARANTTWVAFCDDDDLWAPDKLASQLDAMAATGATWSCTGQVDVNAGLEVIAHKRPPASGDLFPSLLLDNVVPGGGSSVVAATRLVHDVGGFDPTLRSSEDWELWQRLAERAPVAAVDRPLVAYRVWPPALSSDVDTMRTSRRMVLERRAAEIAGRGLQSDDLDYERFLAKQLLRTDRRWRAAATYLGMAAHGHPTQLARAVGAVALPGLTNAFGARRARAAVPAAWLAEVAPWLDSARMALVGT
ncbi:MAG: glycosyltransferase family 2 protein [Acidobacteria bacterium]|nr:glycosyltransferase family 2 protein [Acidobacteriota bacterium]